MFKERYTPYITGGDLMQGSVQLNWWRIGLIILALAAPIAALVTWTWAYIILTAIPIFFIGCVVIYNDNFFLLSQKKVQIYLPYHTLPWYDKDRMRILPEYRNAVMEYLEYLRLGQDRNEYVENELWKMHVDLFKEHDEQMNKEKIFIADQFPALKQYKIFKEIR